MFDSTRLFLFLTAAILLAVAPGPGMLYVLARSLAGGKREGVISAIGTFFGGMVHVFAAALGVSMILARSALAFSTVKYVGAAYLCFLGVRMIVDARKENALLKKSCLLFPPQSVSEPALAGRCDGSIQSQNGVVFPLLHPPVRQSRAGHLFLQFIALGTVSVALNTSADLVVILLAGPLGKKIRSSAVFRRRQRTVTGAIMIGLGAYLATSESH